MIWIDFKSFNFSDSIQNFKILNFFKNFKTLYFYWIFVCWINQMNDTLTVFLKTKILFWRISQLFGDELVPKMPSFQYFFNFLMKFSNFWWNFEKLIHQLLIKNFSLFQIATGRSSIIRPVFKIFQKKKAVLWLADKSEIVLKPTKVVAWTIGCWF